MADINVQQVDSDGLLVVFTACAAGGDHLQLVQSGFALFKNTSGASIDVTLITPGTIEGLAVADRVVAVPAGGQVAIDLGRVYTDPVTKRAHVTYSTNVGLSVAIIKGQ